MGKIIQTIKKNYKVLFRNKFSLFILLLGPIILTFLIGFFYFNSNSFAINLGVHSPDDSEFNTFFQTELAKSDFSVLKFNSQLECEDAIKSGILHACIYLPKNFNINDSSNNDLILKLDTSRGDIVAVTENLINDQITKISTQVQIRNTDKLLDIINHSEQFVDYTNSEIEKVTTINNNLKTSNELIKTRTSEFTSLLDIESLGISDLAKNYKNLNSSIDSFTKAGIKSSNITINKITNAIYELDDANSSSSSDIKSLIKTARIESETSNQKFNSIKSSYDLKLLGATVIKIESKLTDATKNSAGLAGDISFDLNQNKVILDNASGILTNINTRGIDFKKTIETLDSKNAQTLMTPISVDIQNVVANSSVHLVSVFPSLIVGLIFIISLIMSSMFILTERKNKAHFRNFMSKNSAFNFLIGDFISLTSIVFMQAALIISLYHFWFLKSTDYIQFATLLAMIIPVISIFVLVGMSIGYLTKNESSNVILTFLVILSFLTLSGKILPLEALTSSVAQIAMKNPFLLSEGIIRKFLLFGVEITQMKTEVILLLSYIGLFLFLNFIFESFSKKRFLYGIYAQIVIGIKNHLLRPKSISAPSSTLTSPVKKSTLQVDTVKDVKPIIETIKTEKVDILIKEKESEPEVFELESLASLNEKLKKL